MAGAMPRARMRTDADRVGQGGLDTDALRVAHLEAALSACSDGVLFLDRDGRVISWNKAAERVLSPAGHLAVGTPVAHFFDDSTLFSELLGRAFGGEVVGARLIDVAGGDGRPGPVRLTLVPIRDEVARGHGGLRSAPTSLGCTVVLRDLLEETSSQEALAEAELKVRRAEALAEIGTFVFDAADQSVQWSEGMYRIHGVDPAEFVPSLAHHLDLVVADDRPRVADLFDQTLAGTATTGIDHRVVGGDQSESWLHITVEPRTDAEGHVLGLSGVSQDVNGRVASEAALQQALVAEQAVIEELRRVDALKDEFLATASHELRTPLTSIVGFTEVLTQVAPEQGSLIAPIERNAHDMRRLVEGLLDQARLESGKVTVEPTRFELEPAVQELIAELNPAPEDVRVEIPAHLEILMDVEAFSRVLGNLVGNATKYASDSAITISAERTDEHVSVSVADQGPGIPLEDQEHLFDPFFRAPGASRTARGSGFGLSIVRRYLELHGGDVVCQSSPGHGTTFTFRVPNLPRARP